MQQKICSQHQDIATANIFNKIQNSHSFFAQEKCSIFVSNTTSPKTTPLVSNSTIITAAM